MLEADATFQKILRLESNALLLGDAETVRVLGYKTVMETGGKLDKTALAEINQLIAKIGSAEKTMAAEPDQLYKKIHGGVDFGEPVLTVKKILGDLASAEKMLSAQEKNIYHTLAAKHARGQKFEQKEMEALLAIHADKGF